MNQINLLRQTLKPLLKWHGARLNFLALFIIALLRVKTINFVELATGFRSHAKSESGAGRSPRRGQIVYDWLHSQRAPSSPSETSS